MIPKPQSIFIAFARNTLQTVWICEHNFEIASVALAVPRSERDCKGCEERIPSFAAHTNSSYYQSHNKVEGGGLLNTNFEYILAKYWGEKNRTAPFVTTPNKQLSVLN